MPKENSGQRVMKKLGWVLSFAILAGLAVVGLKIALQASDALLSWQRVQAWQPVTAQLDELELRRIPKGHSNSDAMKVLARYSYTFDGKQYTSEQVGGFEGSLEVDGWHESTYENLLKTRKRTGRSQRYEVTAWVDPVHPENAVLDRTLRWVVPLLLFPVAAFFFGVAWLLGFGLWRNVQDEKLRPPQNIERRSDDPDWTQEPAWRTGVVKSDALNGVVWAWLFLFMAGISAWGAGIGGYHHGRFSLDSALGLLLFGLLACWLAYSAFRKTLIYLRQGKTYLHMTPFPARLGQELRGIVKLPVSAANAEITVSLSCIRRRYTDDNSASHQAVWENIARVRSQNGLSSSVLSFNFMIPAHLPASDWQSRNSPAQDGVNWIVRLESPAAKIDRAFTIPVLSDNNYSAASVGATLLPEGMENLVSVLKAIREKKTASNIPASYGPSLSETKPNPALAAPYIHRNGTELILDTRQQPHMTRIRWSGLLFLLMAPFTALFPAMWFVWAPWRGSVVEIILGVVLAIFLLLPAVGVPLLAFAGIQRMSRRIRVTFNQRKAEVIDQNWIRSKKIRFDTTSVTGIRTKSVGTETGSRGTYRYFDIVLTLNNGREVVLAWSVRDSDVAEALAETLQRACGAPRQSGVANPASAVEVHRRPANVLLLLCVLSVFIPLALFFPSWDGYENDTKRLEHLAKLSIEPGYLHQWLKKDDAIHIPPRWLLRRWTTEARDRLAAIRTAPAGVEVRVVPLNPNPVVIDGVIGAAEWRNALVLPLQPATLGSLIRLSSDGQHLFIAADVPSDTTKNGFDQFRISFHIGLAPGMISERVHVSSNGGISGIRNFRIPKVAGGNGAPSDYYSDWLTYDQMQAASTLDGYRRYESLIDLAEMGIVAGVPFTLWAEIEGDPQYRADGKFKSRTSLGQTGDFKQPVWLQIPRQP